ncbi:U-box domain-containing protein 52-like [Primulina eburnea]|uniref:U-box domain-containing protein 52-like n=1 Tax=Primulina eburnea TaxID=1245227 RepID=UPI003C6C0CF2
MAPQILHDDNPTAVAIDRDKNSTPAVRWAIEHLLLTNFTLILIHVKTKNTQHADGLHGRAAEGIQDIFSPFRAYCARKRIVIKEVILEGVDVHTPLLDYINKHNITKMVLGASSRNALTRKLWAHDVPTMINKAAPDFCSVYVISKGKTQSMRPAARQLTGSTPTHPSSPQPGASKSSSPNPSFVSAASVKGERKNGDRFETSSTWNRNIFSLSSMETDLMDLGSMDITQVQVKNSDKMGYLVDLEATSVSSNEFQRLKQEMKQAMNMYNTACKEAVSAQQRATELQQLKLGEMSRIEQARLNEEAALALVEMEKAKCRAAIEAAEKANKIAERETQRRKYAEMKAKREAEEKNRALDVLSNNDVRYRKYTIEEIEEATSKFSRSMKIGEGGYGPVFKGKLDHTAVAIKVLRPDAAQGRKQFQQEIEVLSCIRHPNMVLLMGACPEYGCLVYEFMNNGSLEDRLFRKGNTPPIPWGIRFKIAADIATGLLFLHQAKPEPLVHRDLKPANILLDHNYTCKISDVGLARLVPPSVADSVTQYHMTSAAGTFCYIDPEYQQTGKLGTKSDIYSLGVLLLQIITARPPMGLTHHVERAIEKGTFADLLDPTVSNWPVEEALIYAKLALKCAELRRKDRPDLGTVVMPELNRLKELGINHVLGHGISSLIASHVESLSNVTETK